jgi:hypothetical protein
MKITIGKLRALLIESIEVGKHQIKVRDDVIWSRDGETYEVMWGSSASNKNDALDSAESEKTDRRRGTIIPSKWYAYIIQNQSNKIQYVPIFELTQKPVAVVDLNLTKHFHQYVSDPFDPKYAIRFVENPSSLPNAERIGNHHQMPNGVYAFVFTKDVYQMLIGNDDKGMGIYFEDIAVTTKHGYILKCNFKNPLVLNKKSWNTVKSMAAIKGHVETQQYLLGQKYDAIIDPYVLIEYEIPQICFLTNDSFQVVEKLIDMKPVKN